MMHKMEFSGARNYASQRGNPLHNSLSNPGHDKRHASAGNSESGDMASSTHGAFLNGELNQIKTSTTPNPNATKPPMTSYNSGPPTSGSRG